MREKGRTVAAERQSIRNSSRLTIPRGAVAQEATAISRRANSLCPSSLHSIRRTRESRFRPPSYLCSPPQRLDLFELLHPLVPLLRQGPGPIPEECLCVCVCVCVCAAPPQELFLCVTDTEPLQPQAYSVRGALPWTTAGTLKGRASPPGVLSAALARAAPASSKTSRRLNLPPPCLLRSNGKRNSDAYFHLVD